MGAVRTEPVIALVTSDFGLTVDTELSALAERIGERARVSTVRWDDPAVDWAAFDLALIRSTWDYPGRVAEFLDWVDRAAGATRLVNPGPLVRWNAVKTYLADLGERGVPVVPTAFVAPGQQPALPAGEFVVKPVVGAGALHAARYGPQEHERAAAQIGCLHADGATVMIQPYQAAVDTAGEAALVFVGGRFRHAVRKGAVLAPGVAYDSDRDAHPDLRRYTPTERELAVAGTALAALDGAPPLYARVDLVPGPDGAPLLMELELIEPDLFLWADPATLDALVTAVIDAALTTP
ncbi:ATP-grasp domain-containing protein [Micromonosporaceae bacterium DT55]|uniref:ATP-grasp domain-containing protein n=1 Tax=Melissospora conviva TaxID=3388432 RepID=UPI003C299D5F